MLFTEADDLLSQADDSDDPEVRDSYLARRSALLRGIVTLYERRPHAAAAVARATALLANAPDILPATDPPTATETP